MTLTDPKKMPKHVAVIMDGNGRWAKNRSLDRVRGHQKGAETVREVVRTSREIGIPWLTLYAFSEENWKRPKTEIGTLMALLKRFLKSELKEMRENGIRLQSIGRIDKLPEDTREILLDIMAKTASNNEMVLTLALSYGGRQEILDAVRDIAGKIEREEIAANEITEQLISDSLYTADMPDPDLLIRTSGENRISNFLLWQIQYTEIYVTPTLWPDFNRAEYLEAIRDFQNRVRRFGRTVE
ncbi:MAG: isoprenyl transferase [Thermodesulfobacteriota bacterium]|nr:isoprenyl transferase [Thermodesulfobacteriota bacterium]